MRLRKEMPDETLVDDFPESLRDLFGYVRSLHFEEEPDYVFLNTQLNELLEQCRAADTSPLPVMRMDSMKRAQTVKYAR